MTIIGRQQTGLDLTTHPSNSKEGSLLRLNNAHLTPGGEIEKRRAFELFTTLPEGCVGFHSLGKRVTVFGTGARPETLSPFVRYERLHVPVSKTEDLIAVNGAAISGGKTYCIGRFSDGSTMDFYGGQPVQYWLDNASGSVDTMEGVVSSLANRIDLVDGFLATASGTTMTVSAFSDFQFQANVFSSDGEIITTVNQVFVPENPLAEAQASFNVQGSSVGQDVSSVEVDGVQILGSTITMSGTEEEFAQDIASQIELFSAYTAEAIGTVVVITTPVGTGDSGNGRVLSLSFTANVTNITNFLGGQDFEAAIAKEVDFSFVSDFDDEATYQVIINGQDFSSLGNTFISSDFVLSHKLKVWAVRGETLFFSAINDPLEWRPFIPGEEGNENMAAGAGFMRITDEAGESGFIRGLSPFGEFLSVFAEDTLAFLTVDPDPNLTYQTGNIIKSTGTKFAKSVIALGAQDVLYIGKSGVESLRLRASVDAPFVQDIGESVSTLLLDKLEGIGESRLDSVCAVSDDLGRIWFVVNDMAFVLSYFPNSSIVGWSTYDLPAVVDSAIRVDGKIYLRCGDDVYVYGSEYDDSVVEVISFFTDRDDGMEKTPYKKIICSVENEWRIDLLTDPWNFNHKHRLGQTFSNENKKDGKYGFAPVKTEYAAVGAKCSKNGYAKIHKIVAM